MSGKLNQNNGRLLGEVNLLLPLALTAVRLEKPRSEGRTYAAITLATTCSVFDTGGTDGETDTEGQIVCVPAPIRHILFDEPFQEELANLYQKQERGRPPVAPAMLAPLASSWKRTPVSLMMR
jgi:hypothetical protein